tara:strand:- start:7968 stop:8222 length:255 start_codon:yes stop_codon:yes gene_type:complete
MLVRKLSKGLYEVIDLQNNNYRVEDSTRTGAYDRPSQFNKMGQEYRWGIWEQSKGEWEYLDGNPTFKECLEVISTWSAASQLGK